MRGHGGVHRLFGDRRSAGLRLADGRSPQNEAPVKRWRPERSCRRLVAGRLHRLANIPRPLARSGNHPHRDHAGARERRSPVLCSTRRRRGRTWKTSSVPTPSECHRAQGTSPEGPERQRRRAKPLACPSTVAGSPSMGWQRHGWFPPDGGAPRRAVFAQSSAIQSATLPGSQGAL